MLNYINENLKNNILSPEFRKIICSNKKSGEFKKIDIEVKLDTNDEKFYQFSCYYDDKVKHINTYDADDCIVEYKNIILDNFKQIDFIYSNMNDKFLINKKGDYKLISKNITSNLEIQSHNKSKNYILKEDVPINWLVELDIMDKNGRVYNGKKKKFKQINKFLELIESSVKTLDKNPTIVDFGCGKSYLTFALYYYLTDQGYNPTIIGLDLKADVVDLCNKLAVKFEFKNLSFINQDVKNYIPDDKIDMIISLHACDIATDYALYAGIKWNSQIIMSVPCCHSEVFNQIVNPKIDYILKHGDLKEKYCSVLTDSIRGLLLEIHGYKTNIYQFVDLDDTPKNTMIQGVKSKKKNSKLEIELNEILSENKLVQTLNELLK